MTKKQWLTHLKNKTYGLLQSGAQFIDKKARQKAHFYKAKNTTGSVEEKPPQIGKDDVLYSLVQLVTQHKGISESRASYHPFINFLVKRREQLTESEQKTLAKMVANFETFLTENTDKELVNTFLAFFASKQGLLLFRCNILTIRYFSRMVLKLAANKSQFYAVFTALEQPELLQEASDYDRTVQAILTNDFLAGEPDDQAIREWVLNTML